MQRIRVNLAALRGNRLPRARQTGLTPSQLLASANALPLSRRDMLGLAGVAAVGISPALKAFGGTFLGPVEIVGGENRVAFKLAGRERWVIDTCRFGGTPRLRMNRSERLIRLELLDARYPGTDLPADMVCELRRGAAGWRMHLRLALGGFRSALPLERWLVGAESAQSRVSTKVQVCGLGTSSGIEIAGSAVAEFFPNWVLRLSGPRVARMFGLGGEIFSNSITVSLLGPEDPSILKKPESRRTLISLERGEHGWFVTSALSAGDAGKLISTDNPFDVLNVEAGEGRTGVARRALVAEASGQESRVAFQPEGDLTGNDGTAFKLPLRNLRYAVAFEPTGEQAALVADFSSDPVWLHANGCSVQLGDCAGITPFELISWNGQVEKMRCAPAVHRVVAPLPGAIVESTQPAEGARLAFVSAALSPQAQIRPGQVRIDPRKQAALLRLPPLSVSVVRPDDLLTLDFSFVNLTLEAGGPQPRLVRIEAGKPAYIVVQFPPQNIAEQAFFEADPNYKVPPTDPDASKTSEELKEPPVLSLLSGPSRLAFIVPDETEEIPYSLESLLDWTKYEPSVAPTALPPPPPVARGIKAVEPGRALPQPRTQVLQPSQQNLQLRPGAHRPSAKDQKQKAKAPAQPPVEQQQLKLQLLQKWPNLTAELVERLSIQEPALYQTAIEAPYRLIISPNRFAGWINSRVPVEHNGRTELWHARLGVRTSDGKVDERSPYYRTVRAIWSPDFDPKKRLGPGRPFRMSLDSADRDEIVHLSADFNMSTSSATTMTALVAPKPYEPKAIQVAQLMLSPLGAWLNVRGAWDTQGVRTSTQPVQYFSVEEWRHRGTMGRDHYVRVVYRGYLFPFGHRVSLIKITERKFQPIPKGDLAGKTAAYLRQRMYIVVRQPEKEYPATDQQHGGRKMPFRRLRITTLVTPNLDLPTGLMPGKEETAAFWVRAGGGDFPFHFVGEDIEGQEAEFTAPVIFVKSSYAFESTSLQSVFDAYQNQSPETRRHREMRGQKVGYAKSLEPGDTTFETETITFEAESNEGKVATASLVAEDQPPFYPAASEAQVRISAVEQLTGTAAKTRIQYHGTYLGQGFDGSQNKGQVFAELVDKVQLQFGGGGASTDKAGGFVAPNMAIGGLSRALGPVGGALDQIVSGKFDPIEFFKGALGDAKILGGITLWDILEVISDFTGLLDKVPKFIPTRLPDAIETSFTWNAVVKDGPDPAKPILSFESPQDAFTVDARLRTPLNGQPPTYEIRASLNNFSVHLVPQVWEVIVLKFKSLSFIAKNGQKPDVSVDFDSYEFLPPLNYIDQLLRSIPLDGFKDPPSLDITPQGLKLGYTLGVPAVTLGVMSLQNIALGAEFSLPFTGDPINVRFNLCERHNPFLLTVWIFGGGGFFALELEPTSEGLKRLEGAFEFGGNFALDIGVASGGVHVMAGIYFAITSQKTQLTGYLRCGGSVDVLGIICISVEFYMELSYVSPPTRVWGRATLTIEIEILFFSISVDLTVEREFAGGGAETAFVPVAGDYAPALPVGPALAVEDMMTAEDWAAYCEAFA